MHYDVAIIGAGPAGIFCAYQLIEENKDLNIIEMIETLNKIAPGTNSADTLLYGVEVKFYSARLKLTQELETEITNMFGIGDG